MSHCASAPLAFMLRWIAGSATLTTVPSMKAMLEPSTALTSVQRPASASGEGVAAAGMRAFSAAREGRVSVRLPAEAFVVVGGGAALLDLGQRLGIGQQRRRVLEVVAHLLHGCRQRRVAIVGGGRQFAVAQQLVRVARDPVHRAGL